MFFVFPLKRAWEAEEPLSDLFSDLFIFDFLCFKFELFVAADADIVADAATDEIDSAAMSGNDDEGTGADTVVSEGLDANTEVDAEPEADAVFVGFTLYSTTSQRDSWEEEVNLYICATER